MCNWGDNVTVRVTVPADLSSTGQEKVRDFGIDRCIAPIVAALEATGIKMSGSCCGHGKCNGEIVLADGRTLAIASSGKISSGTGPAPQPPKCRTCEDKGFWAGIRCGDCNPFPARPSPLEPGKEGYPLTRDELALALQRADIQFTRLSVNERRALGVTPGVWAARPIEEWRIVATFLLDALKLATAPTGIPSVHQPDSGTPEEREPST